MDGELRTVFQRQDELFELTLRSTPDNLKLFIDLKPGKDFKPLTKEELESLFPPNVHRPLLHQSILDDIITEVNSGKPVTERRIAKGREAEQGRDGKILFLVKRYQPKDIEWVEPRFMRTFDNVEKGVVVARLYSPTTGSDGQDIFGQPIKSKPGKPAKCTLESSLSLKPDSGGYQPIVSELAGYLSDSGGKLSIKDELAIQGNVDIKCGDIDFIGKVRVSGGVMKDFQIRARDEVLIGGETTNASVSSERGAVIIRGSAIGSSVRVTSGTEHSSANPEQSIGRFVGAEYHTAKVFQAHSAQGIRVEALGDIIIEKEVSNCSLRTRGLLWIPRGHLFGGETYVVCGVEGRILGTKAGSETTIFLCSDVESSLEYGEVQHQIHQAEAAVELLRLHLGPYAENPTRLSLLKEPLQTKQKKLYAKLHSVLATIHTLEEKRNVLLKGASHNPTLRVNFHERLHPGVTIVVGEHRFTTEKELTGPGTVEFLPDVGRFTIRELKPLECNIERPTVPVMKETRKR